MSISVIFKLKEPQKGVIPSKQIPTPVNMFFNYGYYELTREGKKKYLPLKFATKESIKPCYWKDRPDYRAKHTREFDYDSFNAWLETVERAVKIVYRNEITAGRLPEPDQLRILLKKELNLIPEIANPKIENLNEYIERFVNEIEAGTRLTPGKIKKKYTPGTVRNYRSFKNKFNEYQEDRKRKLDFDHINKEFYNDFVNYFTDKQQSPNNIGKHVKSLKVIMRAAFDEKLHTNSEMDQKYFNAMRYEVQEIYLTQAEIEKIEKLDLSYSKFLDGIRDVFLIGVYTAQRYSDYSRIRKENVRTTAAGTKIIDLIQKKTGERVMIPISPQLDKILKKYDYSIPKTFDQKVNKHIKDLAEAAEINEIITVKKTKGGMDIVKDYAKYSLIKTHTARRSGATNMYLAGIPTIDIMKLTGHKTETEFLNYIKVGKEETADNLSRRDYFNQHLKIAK